MFKMDVRTFFPQNYSVASRSTLYLTVTGIILLSLKMIGQLYMNKITNQIAKDHFWNECRVVSQLNSTYILRNKN